MMTTYQSFPLDFKDFKNRILYVVITLWIRNIVYLISCTGFKGHGFLFFLYTHNIN